jgi:electron transfer flavoprotein alpha subunit
MAVKVDKEKCTGCAACKSACPMDTIEMKDGKAQVNDMCVECGACISECPRGALSL